MSKQTNSKTIKTSIGGQAVIEGVMMRGPKLTALSVRMPDQSISTETWDTPNSNKWYKKTPFIRGVFNFVESLTDGYKSLMKAAEKAGLDDEEEEPSKFEQKLRQLLGDKFMPFLQGCILLFSLAMALFFFAFLPTTLVGFFKDYINHPLALSALEGLTKIAILILYLALISNMSDIKRVFMYHGAEHKTIFCYEHGEELTVENVRKYTRFPPALRHPAFWSSSAAFYFGILDGFLGQPVDARGTQSPVPAHHHVPVLRVHQVCRTPRQPVHPHPVCARSLDPAPDHPRAR